MGFIARILLILLRKVSLGAEIGEVIFHVVLSGDLIDCEITLPFDLELPNFVVRRS